MSKDETGDLRYKCHICGALRPKAELAELTKEVSLEGVTPPSDAILIVKYCNDNPNCEIQAKSHTYVQKKREETDDNNSDLQ